MSKSATKALINAESFLKLVNINVSLVAFLNDGKTRTHEGKKLWRNADILASLIINSAANALQCENDESLVKNGFNSMSEAVEGYIDSNLYSWNQKRYVKYCANLCGTRSQLDHLAEIVKLYRVELDQKIITNQSPKLTAFYEAYKAWLDNGAPEGKPFSRFTGLCSCLRFNFTSDYYAYMEMKRQFIDAGLSEVYPFGQNEYDLYGASGTQHLDPKRIQWVMDHIPE